MRHLRRVGVQQQDDPLEGVANLFDLGIVFALGFLVALVASFGLPELLDQRDVTIVKNPGTSEMQIIRREGTRLERYTVTQDQIGGDGERLGVAYRLKSGEVVYVPEGEGRDGAAALPE